MAKSTRIIAGPNESQTDSRAEKSRVALKISRVCYSTRIFRSNLHKRDNAKRAGVSERSRLRCKFNRRVKKGTDDEHYEEMRKSGQTVEIIDWPFMEFVSTQRATQSSRQRLGTAMFAIQIR